MEKHRAIPEGYMRIGALAKQVNVTVRTLQYYDKEGLLSPSGESEGGFRLYTHKDIARLMQILMMKKLGFSLGDIKTHLVPYDTPQEVAQVLTDQAKVIQEKINILQETMTDITQLKEEISETNQVDFYRYAAILQGIQSKMETYWMVKHLDLDVVKSVREKLGTERMFALSQATNRMNKEALALLNAGITPDNEAGINFARHYWETLLEYTGGDTTIIEELNAAAEKVEGQDKKWDDEYMAVRQFTIAALTAYLGYE